MLRRCSQVLPLLVICLLMDAARAATATDAVGWAEKMAASEMKRRGDSLSFGKDPKAKWAYETGVFLKGLEAVWSRTGDGKYYDYLKAVVDSFVNPDGSITSYKLEEYTLDNINCGKLLLSLYQRTREDKYRKAASMLMKQLETQPRTREGGFWHKQIYPFQMWLDGIYMASPFMAQYARIFNMPAGFDEVANQVIWMENHARDGRTGLLYHGWDESHAQEWADPKTGCSKCFWGRAMGWYAMGIVDVLDFLPEKHPRRRALIAILARLSRALANYQDKETGLWYQVVDQGGRDGNYLEASASSMFVYAFAKGVRKGYLGGEYAARARKGYEGLVNHLVKPGEDGSISLTQICSVGGLGGPQKRDGTFEYYMSEPVVANDLKGIGAFLMASIEVDLLSTAGASK
ncbi:MAG: glycoside hydrolase family 88 protein [Acidobacteriia bacterium]|nr:glycoside hydrolase family 88 protein [Terriglobia bacterium]